MKKSEVIEQLGSGVVNIEFTKADGSLRVMKSTLSSEHVISEVSSEKSAGVQRIAENVQPVWDVDAKGWRSFRWASITEVNGVKTPSGVDVSA